MSGGGAAARRRLHVDWGHLLVATAMAGGVVAYLLEARAVSLSTNNLLLVQPVALLALLLYLLVLPQCIRFDAAPPAEETPTGAAIRAEGGADLLRVAALAVCFGLFILGLETIGFDVSAWLFTLVALWIGGERRWPVLLLFPPVFAAAVILLFRLMMPYPMTTLLL
ncbi:MAG TPA: hypothetical protein VGN83_08225 [Falsiroseomonas sp.]|jgi:hypothetical protein|nr:hypothetical protein [Falsiroseomonas sp.]